MRVLHLIGGTMMGGAAKAALAIHDALVESGVDSHLVQSHGNATGTTETLEATLGGKSMRFLRTVADRTIASALMAGGDGRKISPAFFGAPIADYRGKGDILHLHWFNDGGFRLPRFGGLGPQTVWTLHDMWALTAGCHHALDCTRYEGGCNNSCPAMGRGAIFAGSMQRTKARAVREGVQCVGVSSWLSRTAERSRVLAGKAVRTIPNTVDTSALWPVSKPTARAALGLDANRRILLIGHAGSSRLKGVDLLADALELIDPGSQHLDVVGFGSRDGPLAGRYTKHFGYAHDATTLRLLFSAADVFALPSRAESFGRTVIEAFACGTPVVAFAGTGPDDVITPETGRLIPAFDIGAFADALIKVAVDSTEYIGPCRQRAVNLYSYNVVAQQYIDLYEDIVAGRV